MLTPLDIPEEKRRPFAELITRVNFNYDIGNFEMNFDTGQIVFKTTLRYYDDQTTNDLMPELVWGNVMTMGAFLPAGEAVLKEDTFPVEAYELFDKESEKAKGLLSLFTGEDFL